MKTLILILISFFVWRPAHSATDKEKVSFDTASVTVIQDKNVFFVNYFSRIENERNIIVSIYNEQNQVVFTETINNTGSFKKPYNFFGLPDGIYIIKITDEQMVTIRPVRYVAEITTEMAAAAERLQNLKKDLLIRVSRTEDKSSKYKIDILSDHIHQLELKIYDKNNELVYEGATESKTSRVYVLRNPFSDKFQFKFYDKEKNLIQEIVH